MAVDEPERRRLPVEDTASARGMERRMAAVVVEDMGSEKVTARIEVVAGRSFVLARMQAEEDIVARLDCIVVVVDTVVLADVRHHSWVVVGIGFLHLRSNRLTS